MSGLMDVFGSDDASGVNPETRISAPTIQSEPRAVNSPPEASSLVTPPPSATPRLSASRPPASAFGHDHSPELDAAVKAAARTADAARAAKAALDQSSSDLMADLNKRLEPLKAALNVAEKLRKESEIALLRVMEIEKVSKIPMDDRPEIKIKITPGGKKPITKTWLSDPEGVVVKTYGPGAPSVIWDAVPSKEAKTEVLIPPPYEDEPSI